MKQIWGGGEQDSRLKTATQMMTDGWVDRFYINLSLCDWSYVVVYRTYVERGSLGRWVKSQKDSNN